MTKRLPVPEEDFFTGAIGSLACIMDTAVMGVAVSVNNHLRETEQADVSVMMAGGNWSVDYYEAAICSLLDNAVEHAELSLAECSCKTCDERLWRLREALAVFKRDGSVKELARS